MGVGAVGEQGGGGSTVPTRTFGLLVRKGGGPWVGILVDGRIRWTGR